MADRQGVTKGKAATQDGLLRPERSGKREKFRSLFRSRSKSPQPVGSQAGDPSVNYSNITHKDVANQRAPNTGPPQSSLMPTSGPRRKADSPQDASITELWNVAYEELQVKEPKLIAAYEQYALHSVTTVIGATSGLSGLGKVRRREQMEILVKQKVDEDEKGQWKIPFGDDRIAVRDLAKPVVSIVSWAQEFVGDALEASPYGSLAWVGVCLLLPVS